MLRESCEKTNLDLTPEAIVDTTLDCGVPHGGKLLQFTDAVLLGSEDQRTVLRAHLMDVVGRLGLVDAAGSVANFEMMNRIADGTGMPVSQRALGATAEWRPRVGLG